MIQFLIEFIVCFFLGYLSEDVVKKKRSILACFISVFMLMALGFFVMMLSSGHTKIKDFIFSFGMCLLAASICSIFYLIRIKLGNRKPKKD